MGRVMAEWSMSINTWMLVICAWYMYVHIVLRVFPFSLFLFRNSLVHTDRVNVFDSKMVLKAVRWSLPILIFWRNHFSMICQVWLHCLHSLIAFIAYSLSSDNEIEINIHEELDLHIKNKLVNLLDNSIGCFSYSDIILVYIPAWFFFAIYTLTWKT